MSLSTDTGRGAAEAQRNQQSPGRSVRLQAGMKLGASTVGFPFKNSEVTRDRMLERSAKRQRKVDFSQSTVLKNQMS